MAVLVAGTLLMSTFLPRDLPPIVDAFTHRAEQRVQSMDEWRRTTWPALPPHVHRGVGSDVEQWRPLIEQYFPPRQVNTAMCVLRYESGGNPNAKNPHSTASGLFQHLASYWDDRSAKAGWDGADIFDPEANVAVAAWLQDTGGWAHWEAWKKHCR